MKKLSYEINIEANTKKVFETLTDPDGFQKWTSVFSPTSRFEGNWKKGTEMRFISTGENGLINGMMSRIAENSAFEFISIEHYGMIQEGREITEGPDIESLAGCFENYRFVQEGKQTRLIAEIDSFDEFVDYFDEVFPKSLAILKELCEK